MPRPMGTRDPDYEAKRDALLVRLGERLGEKDGHRASLRDLAVAAGVSLPTLKHYFGSREGIVSAYLEACRRGGAFYLAMAARPSGPFATSIQDFVALFVSGFSDPRAQQMHAIGLTEGLQNAALGPAYLTQILEPTLAAVEQRLAAHMEAGEMQKVDPRHAALALVAPLFVAGLHQTSLGGTTVRALDISAFATAHAARFVADYRET